MHRTLLAAAAAALAVSACASTPTLPLTPEPPPLASASGVRPLRVLTFNIQSALRGLEGVAEVIRAEQPDLVALEEVDDRTTRSNGLDQAAELARLTGMPYAHHFAATPMHGGQYGVALLSRVPLQNPERFPLPNWRMTEPRVVGRATVDFGSGPLSVYVTHLTHWPTHGPLRVAQAKTILAIAEKDPQPKLLLGDFNDGRGSAVVSEVSKKLTDVFGKRGEGRGETYPLPLFFPNLTLDYVFASNGLTPVRSRVVKTLASDHYALMAEIAQPALAHAEAAPAPASATPTAPSATAAQGM